MAEQQRRCCTRFLQGTLVHSGCGGNSLHLFTLLTLPLLTLAARHTPLPMALHIHGSTTHEAVLPSKVLDRLPERGAAPEYELVVCRYAESPDDLSWLQQVPAWWQVTVLNKGNPLLPLGVTRDLEVHHCPQLNDNGREGELIAAYIWQRWNSLADFTAFTQGNPMEHNPEYVQLLSQQALLSSVQTMSYLFKAQETNPDIIRMHQHHPLFRSAVFSLRTLDSVYYRDESIWGFAQQIAANFSVPVGTNLVAHYFKTIGLPGWVQDQQEIGRFAFGAIFGVHKHKIRQHSRDVYARISTSVIDFRWTGILVERCWMMLFGGADFSDL